MRTTLRQLGPLALALSGATATFVLTTVLMDQVPDGVLIAAALVGALLVAGAWQGARGLSSLGDSRNEVIGVAGAGVLAFWAAPLLALTQRATDSPSGSDAVMLTTAAWGALVLVAAFIARRGRAPYVVPAAGLAALFGAAAILANWERPSSLNLFVKATERELVIVAAGVVFAIGAVRLASGIARLGARRALLIAVGAATAVGVVYALPALPAALPSLTRAALTLSLLGLAYGAFCLGWVQSTSTGGVRVAAMSLLLAPAALTGLSVVERAVGVFGPNPLVWPGVIAGMALCVAAAAALFASGAGGEVPPAKDTAAYRVVLVIAGAATAAGLVALFLPSISATSEGSLGEGFFVTWDMLGFETAAGWMPLVASLLVLAGLLDLRRGQGKAGTVAASLAAVVAVFTVSALSDVPLHTWTSWIPPDVQQTYGTEYARLTTESLMNPAALVSLVLAGVAALATLVLALRTPSGTDLAVTEEGN